MLCLFAGVAGLQVHLQWANQPLTETRVQPHLHAMFSPTPRVPEWPSGQPDAQLCADEAIESSHDSGAAWWEALAAAAGVRQQADSKISSKNPIDQVSWAKYTLIQNLQG